NHVGGPMYYIKNGLGHKWLWLAMAFAIFGGLAGFGIGNAFQANQVAAVMHDTFGVNPWVSGFAMAIFVGVVLIGGIQRLGSVAGKLVPAMCVVYVLGGLIILLINFTEIPAALVLIVKSAFTPVAAVGGFAGAAVAYAIQMGVARGIFSNEAGLGSAPIAHAAARGKDPVPLGTIAMLGTFIDTIIVCTITGLVIIVTGVWTGEEQGAALSTAAFKAGFAGGEYIVTFGITLFALTTLLGWSYYGEKCVEYIFGIRSIMIFRLLWVIAIPVGATYELKNVVLVTDTLNALMALPNLVALLLLSPIIFKITRDYFAVPG
ncbi:MAG TPA: amino acid carrier protein, partial [Gammaproteobacteria bacterium]